MTSRLRAQGMDGVSEKAIKIAAHGHNEQFNSIILGASDWRSGETILITKLLKKRTSEQF
jgi:hypothetical protein